MKGINVRSEIKPLKKVLLHRPGRELLNLTPDTLGELLFDDIPFLKVAQAEHDAFAQILRDNGAEVVYLEDLMTEVLEQHPELVKTFLYQWLEEARIYTKNWQDRLYNYLIENYKGKELVLKTMEGITRKELGDFGEDSLVDLKSEPGQLLVDPMPNLYFTRDPFASIGSGVSLNQMKFPTRNRETIYADYIFRYHADFKGLITRYSDRTSPFHIEGGDILNLSDKVLGIGISQRTCAEAIEQIAKKIFADPTSTIRTVIAFDIPVSRAFMHLDTVFTQIDYDKFTVHPGIIGPLRVFVLTPGAKEGELHIEEVNSTLQKVLEKYLEQEHVDLIPCGGDDRIAAEREQWNDGSNTLCIAPGTIVVYERNDVTNALLREKGVKVIEMPSAELSRGRGGPRCMSMPLCREE
ncbi:MAG: arginine deiminase [Bacillales bacterium]